MVRLHPACGCPTPFIAKVVAICDLIFGLVGIFWFVYILDGYDLLMKDPSTYAPTTFAPIIQNEPFNINSTQNLTLNPSPTFHPVVSLTTRGFMINGRSCNIALSAFYTMVNFVAFVLLLSASNDKNICKLKTWFVIRLTIFTFKGCLYVVYIIVGATLHDHIPHMIFMIVHLYGMWVVWVFIKEIKEERRNMKKLSETSVPHIRIEEA